MAALAATYPEVLPWPVTAVFELMFTIEPWDCLRAGSA